MREADGTGGTCVEEGSRGEPRSTETGGAQLGLPTAIPV